MTRWLSLSLLLTLAALAGSFYVYTFEYDRLPEQVPIHWNLYGEPDNWVSKENVFMTFLLMPAAMAGVVALTLLLPWLSPRHFKVDRFRDTYGYIMMLVVALLGYLHLVILWGSMHADESLSIRWLIGGLFLFFALLGNVLGQVRRNFWIGVRTPWTLASDTVWDRTHRLAAWVFVAAGLLGLAAVLAGVPFEICFAGLMLAVLVPVIYSLVLYKRLEKEGKV